MFKNYIKSSEALTHPDRQRPVPQEVNKKIDAYSHAKCERACLSSFPTDASGEWTAARHLIGYQLTNRFPPTPIAWPMHVDWAVFYNKQLGYVSPNLVFFSSSSGVKTL